MATKQAQEVDYRWKLGCVIANRGNVLSTGRVRYRHNPAVHANTPTWHAEKDALRRLPKGG